MTIMILNQSNYFIMKAVRVLNGGNLINNKNLMLNQKLQIV